MRGKKMAFRSLRLLRSQERQGSLCAERWSNLLFRKVIKLGYIISLLLVLFALLGGRVQAQQISLSRRPESAGQAWQVETVDSEGGRDTSLALDSAGRPHISYTGGGYLKYTWYNGSSWQIETVDRVGYEGVDTSLALDAAGRPHISYYGSGLEYAWHDGTSWQIETVDSEGRVGWDSFLALDSAGRPHISYCAFTWGHRSFHCHTLKYAYHDGTSWHIEALDSGLQVGNSSTLLLDAAGHPHISYSGKGVGYAYHDGIAWQIETVDSNGEVPSLALDAGDRPHISYKNHSSEDMRYAHHDGSSWQIETVDGGGCTPSLVLDAAGRPHISYYDSDNRGLKYAYHDGSSWRLETVDGEREVGWWPSLVLDTAGRPHISYHDNSNYSLKYAHVSAQSFADPAFESVWQRTDKPITEGRTARSWMWGPAPFTAPLYEPYAESPGGSRLVQYFDKSRMEINDPNGDRSSPWFVSNGLLVREMVNGWVQTGDSAYETRGPAQEAVAGDPVAHNANCPTYASFANLTWQRANHQMGQKVAATLAKDGTVGEDATKAAYSGTEIAYYEEATGHNVPQVLWNFMNQRGLIYEDERYRSGLVVDWLYAMGYPISEPYWTRCTVAGEEKDVLVQLFERRVLTYTPSNPAGWQVEMGNVGLHYYNWRYGIEPTP